MKKGQYNEDAYYLGLGISPNFSIASTSILYEFTIFFSFNDLTMILSCILFFDVAAFFNVDAFFDFDTSSVALAFDFVVTAFNEVMNL